MTQDIMFLLYVFVLAMFTGYEVITKVPPILHTPLMSGANAISGVCLIGAIIITGPQAVNVSIILGMIAVIMATINAVGGFAVTDRMLAMFRKQ